MYTLEPVTLHRVLMPLSQGYSSLWYGYVDESGDPAPFSKQPLVLASVLTQNTRDFELLIHRISRKLEIHSRGGELKASTLQSPMIVRLLTELRDLPIEIYAIEIDKSAIIKPPNDPERLYMEALSSLIRECLQKHPRLELHIDKRYSNPLRQGWLERSIRDNIIDLSGASLIVRQEDSNIKKPIQVADVVMWSLGKFIRGEDQYWQIIKDKICYYEKVSRGIWD